ncbi:MAG: hypothetical protein DI534_14075 [Leifsonia xyli]|nr:MAG: hypothetical protein DI534_14075 [Leifsonia xyli]
MTWRIQILDIAQRDFEAIESYLDEVAPEQTERFIDDFEATVGRVAEQPLLRPEIRTEVRRASLRIFRYHVWYRVFPELEYLEILAILHHARGPQASADRL